jgi:rhodanese-related sulfurtransferase
MAPNLLPSLAATELTAEQLLIDVREPYEWEAGHAVGALHVPLGTLVARFSELPTGRDVVMVCHVGARSASATGWLLEQGYPCRNLTGGMVAYAAAGLPLESDTDAGPTVD